MSRISTIASKSKSKKSTKEKEPVNPTAPGVPVSMTITSDIVRLKVVESEGNPVKEITIDKNKRIKDDAAANELIKRILLIKSLAGIQDHDCDALKAICFAAGAKFVDSPNGIAQIASGGEGGSINVAKFWRLCDAKKVPLAKRFEVMSVGKTTVKFLSANEIDKILDLPEVPPQPRLTVQQRHGVAAIPVKQALVTLAKQAAAGKIEDWQPKPKKGYASGE